MTTNEKSARALPVQDARIYPRGGLDVLSRAEVARLRDASAGDLPSCTASIGVAVQSDAGEALDALLCRADEALYRDRENSRDRIETWRAAA